jgi:hypothetical protein
MKLFLLMDSYTKLRNTILMVMGLVLIALVWKFAGYKKTYFIVFFFSIFFLVATLFLGSKLDILGDIADVIILSLTIELPPVLFFLSIRNLEKQAGIAKWISITGLIVSFILCIILFIGLMSGVSGGMIG